MPLDETTPWGVVVPVKQLAVAKSRLRAYGDPARGRLALAFAADVVTACLLCRHVVRVLVVTDDPLAAQTLAALGAVIVPDGPGDGLNAALTHGADRLRRTVGGCGVVTVSSDLPALRTGDLDAALAAVPAGTRAFVADAEARGTTLLAAPPGTAIAPAYGPDSRLRHLESGAVELAARRALRRDVDTPEDLVEALWLGVGSHTAAIASELGCFSGSPARCTMKP